MNEHPLILVVDDEPDARELLSRGLTKLGYQVQTAADGEEACAKLTDQFDAIITDLVMPRLDGLRLLERIPAVNGHAVRVVITSFAVKENVVAALNRGAHFLVEKPFTAQQMADVLAKLLSERTLSNSLETILETRLAKLSLSDHDRQLIIYVLKGLSNREIADLFRVSEQTVKNQLFALYRRLNINSRSELFHLIFPI